MGDIQFVYQDGGIKHTIYIPVSTIMISNETLKKTLKEVYDNRPPPLQVIMIQTTPSSRLVVCDVNENFLYVADPANSDMAFSHCVLKMALESKLTVEQCVRLAEALTELVRNPLAVCSVINEFLKPGANTEVDNEEPVPPTVRTGYSHGE